MYVDDLIIWDNDSSIMTNLKAYLTSASVWGSWCAQIFSWYWSCYKYFKFVFLLEKVCSQFMFYLNLCKNQDKIIKSRSLSEEISRSRNIVGFKFVVYIYVFYQNEKGTQYFFIFPFRIVLHWTLDRYLKNRYIRFLY